MQRTHSVLNEGPLQHLISIIIVSYETRELTRACLSSIIEQTRRTSYETLVVDNASRDGSADMIESTFPTVKLIRSEENLGFSKANNLAAKRSCGSYLLLLNPDTVVLDGAIDKILAFAGANPSAGIWGGRTVYADGSLNPSSCWRRQTLWSVFCQALGLTSVFKASRVFNSEAYGSWNRDNVREVDIVTGCFFLIRRELWERLGGFDESFFMYGEEADLCLRARKLGTRPMITPEATIIHHGGASERVRSEEVVRLYRAKVQLMERDWTPLAFQVGKWLIRANVLRRVLWHWLRSVGRRGGVETEVNPFVDVWKRRREWVDTRDLVASPAEGSA